MAGSLLSGLREATFPTHSSPTLGLLTRALYWVDPHVSLLAKQVHAEIQPPRWCSLGSLAGSALLLVNYAGHVDV